MPTAETAFDHREGLHLLQHSVGRAEQCLDPKGFPGASQCFCALVDTSVCRTIAPQQQQDNQEFRPCRDEDLGQCIRQTAQTSSGRGQECGRP